MCSSSFLETAAQPTRAQPHFLVASPTRKLRGSPAPLSRGHSSRDSSSFSGGVSETCRTSVVLASQSASVSWCPCLEKPQTHDQHQCGQDSQVLFFLLGQARSLFEKHALDFLGKRRAQACLSRRNRNMLRGSPDLRATGMTVVRLPRRTARFQRQECSQPGQSGGGSLVSVSSCRRTSSHIATLQFSNKFANLL